HESTVKDLMKKIKGPDFPTGGIIMGIAGIREAYETGRGRLVVRGRVHQEQPKKGKTQVIITELPYQVNKSRLVEKIAELVRTKKIEGINDLRDESDKSGMRVVVELKKDSIPNVVINSLYKNTQLEDTFGIIMLSLVDGVPRTLNLLRLIEEYTKHRFDVVVRRTKYELKKSEEREHILKGLLIALDNLDEVIKTIRSSKDVPTARKRLVKNFELTAIQAQAILDLRLHRLTGLERDKIKLEHEQLAERIKELKQLLGSNELIYRVVKDELKEIKKKYNDGRRTDITTDISDIEIEDLIPEEENVISISHSGYIKRVPVTTYRKQGRGGRGVTGTDLKEDDFVKHLFIASTHHYIMFFSNLGKVYRLKVHQIPTGSRMSKGKAIVNLLPFVPGEMVAAIIAVKDYGDDQYLVMATKKGIIKKTSIEVYDTSRRDGIIAITIKKEDELIGVEKSNGNNDIIMVSRNGKAIRFSEEDCRPIGRTSQGVKGMKLSKGDEVLSMMVARELDGDLFVLTENGYGKRTQLSEYKKQKRGGLGVRTLKITEKKGKVSGAGILKDEHDVMIISDRGVLIRIPARSISRIGRSTQGIKAINLEEGAKVASYSIVVSES
ncbi:MAG: DNA gyrase subunit A, partial [Candidatus Hydromicrobium sp.]